jgi:hypothetical protein
MSKPYTIGALIADLSKHDPDAPVLVAYWTPDIFNLTNEQFAQFIQENDPDDTGIVNLAVANEELADWVNDWKHEQGLEDSNE